MSFQKNNFACSPNPAPFRPWNVIAFSLILAGAVQVSHAQEVRFFASQSQSKASAVAGSASRRVSLGPTPASPDAKRLHEGRTVPDNQLPGLRVFDPKSLLKFDAFRGFGARQRGAARAPGAT